MGSVTGGAFGTFVGKVGDVVGYIRLGKPCVRNAPKKSTKPRSSGQLNVNKKFQMGRKLISHTKDFINVGFRVAALGTGATAQNLASSWNIKEAITGVKPNFLLDYSKVLLSKGDLPGANQPVVEYVYPNLKFQWSVASDLEAKYERDQVMLLAYHPKWERSFSVLSGNRRNVGEEELYLIPMAEYLNKNISPEDDFVETYISFISDDRNEISDSVYLGRVYLSSGTQD